MDTWQAIDTTRAIRKFDGRPLEPEHLRRILDAGRRSGSSKNQQSWDFVVCTERDHLRQLAAVGPYAQHLAGAAVAIALVVAGTFLGLITRWHLRYLTTAEAQKIIAEHPDASVELAQFKNGSSELSITLRGSRNHPDFKAPADESTLSLLTQKGIAYPTYIQGPDFGFADPVPRWSLLCILLLLSGAGLLLWWASKSQTSSPAPASRV